MGKLARRRIAAAVTPHFSAGVIDTLHLTVKRKPNVSHNETGDDPRGFILAAVLDLLDHLSPDERLALGEWHVDISLQAHAHKVEG